MRLPAIPSWLAWAVRVVASLLFVVLFVGLGLDWLPFGWMAPMLALAFALPFCWPRQAGSWPGLALLIALSWIPVWALRRNGLSPESTTLLLLLMLSALAASPGAIVLLMARRSASVAVMLLGFVFFPCLFSVLLARIGIPPLDSAGVATTAVSSQLAWVPGMWYPLLGMCLGSLGFVLSLGWLIVREARRAS